MKREAVTGPPEGTGWGGGGRIGEFHSDFISLHQVGRGVWVFSGGGQPGPPAQTGLHSLCFTLCSPPKINNNNKNKNQSSVGKEHKPVQSPKCM